MPKLPLLLISSFFLLESFAQQFHPEIYQLAPQAQTPFVFGVASGDPTQSSVVLWTKILKDDFSPVEIKFAIALDTMLTHVVQRGEVILDSGSAFTFKKKIEALSAGTTYFYQFKMGNYLSPIGRTKTAPTQADSLKFAVVSCNNYEHGFFNAYRLIANRSDIDAVVHLGDYIYEYSREKMGRKKAVRQHIPAHEIYELRDYRSRYAQYRLDTDLQEAHRLYPFIAVWDDHEFANNTYKNGAGNHQADEGDWEVRKGIAKKVYFEWLPITDNATNSITRAISYGNLATLYMMDERTEERSKQLVDPYDPNLYDTSRYMIGPQQAEWLIEGMKKSTATWKVIANQVMFSEIDAHQMSKKHAKFLDTWDGYPAERKMIMDSFYANGMKNIVVVTGDIHTSWALDLVADPQNKNSYNAESGKGVIGVEFVTPSVSSKNLDELTTRPIANFLGSILMHKSTNPHLRFINTVDHGFLVLSLTNEKAIGEWVFCETVRKKTTETRPVVRWGTKVNENKLEKE
jgi:alkaline phosphatase D